jgi:hypothetical protein
MMQLIYLVLGILIGGIAMSATDGQTTLDPVKLSPQYYAVRFENDRVRVLEYHLKPGEKEVMHSHPPGIVYVLADATVRTTLPDRTTSEHPGKAGEVFWRDETTHAVENIGSTESQAIAIELKACKQ